VSGTFKKYLHHEFSGKGNIRFQDETSYSINFQIYLYNSGGLGGSMLFTSYDDRLNETITRNETFTLDGETQDGLTLSAEHCGFYSFTPTELINIPLLTARFIVSRLKIFDGTKLKNANDEKVTLDFQFGILNYYSPTNFLLRTEIGEIQSSNILSDEEITIFKNSFIPFISTVFRIQIQCQKSLEFTKQTVLKVIRNVLELTSFALTTEHRWSYFKIYLIDSHGELEFAYSECINQLPRPAESHNNIAYSRLQEFLDSSYNNYNPDELNKKYNFHRALLWYLDSISLRYEVMRYISASTALESILAAFNSDSEEIISKKQFRDLSRKIKNTINDELSGKISQQKIEMMLKKLPNINRHRHHYMSKVENLLEALGILDDKTKNSLSEIIDVRNKVTHTGTSKDLDKEKIAETYFKLFSLLTKIFFRILVPSKDVFTQEFHDTTWKLLR
jgi:hypothetical protein